jgi:hypothetical protein
VGGVDEQVLSASRIVIVKWAGAMWCVSKGGRFFAFLADSSRALQACGQWTAAAVQDAGVHQTFEVAQTSKVFGRPTGDALAAARRMDYTGARRIPPIRF